MNEERPIEKLLRRAAEERRAEAGAPPELHPANRRLLQDEVARQFPAPLAAAPAGWQAFLALLQARWIYAVGSVGAVVIVSLLVVPTMFKSGRDELASLPPAPEAAPAVMTDSTGVSPESAPAMRSAVSEDSGVHFNSAPMAKAVAPATDVPGRTRTQTAGGSVARSTAVPSPKSDAVIKDPELASLAEPAKTKPATPAEADSPLVAFFGLESNAANEVQPSAVVAEAVVRNAQAFEKRMAGAAAGEKKAGADATGAVLRRFKIEQRGRDLRVVDEDGSVYRGVVDEQNTFYQQVVAQKDRAVQQRNDKLQQFQSPKAADSVAAARQDNTEFYLYRVEGTNRTLKRNIVFSWNFVPTNDVLAAAQADYKAALLKTEMGALPSQLPALLNNSSLDGRLELGAGKSMPVQAAPVAE